MKLPKVSYRILNKLAEDPGGCWTHIARSIKLVVEDTIGYTCPKAWKQWYDQESRDTTKAKDTEKLWTRGPQHKAIADCRVIFYQMYGNSMQICK